MSADRTHAGGSGAALDVTAVVVAHDSAGALPACLAALARERVQILVVDNASRDGSAALAERAGATVLRLARNEGYGRANNAGAARATGEFILVCNPDALARSGMVVALLAAATRYPDAGLWAPRLMEPDGRFFFQPRSLLASYLPNPSGRLVLPDGDCCAPFLSGACFVMRRSVFLELGGFDPAIFLFYEDDDLCRRVAESGRALVHVHEAVALHARGRSSAAAPGRVFGSRWHQAWSQAYVSAKWGLAGPAPQMFVVNALKALALALVLAPIFRRDLVARYAGSAAGAWAAMRGRAALAREGLDTDGSGR